jgi:hypothetical protein
MSSVLGAESVRRALLIIWAGAAMMPAWAEIQIEPSISVGAIYVDNINLAPPGTPTSGDEVAEIMPRLQVQAMTPNLTGALDYSAQSVWFRKHPDLHAIHSAGAANGLWTAKPDLFYIDGRATYTQQTIDPTQPNNSNNLFAVGNVSNVFNAMIAPYLQRDFGAMTGLLRYAESISNYSGVAGSNFASLLQNSRSGVVTAKLAADDTDAPFAWRVDARSARTTFRTAEPFRDDQFSAEESASVLPSLRLTGVVGAETNVLTHSASGGLNAGFWAAGFKWSPSTRTVLEASAGHRFFGPAYLLRWTHQTRLLNFKATYTEDATAAGQSDALTEFLPGEIPADPRAYSGVLRSISTFAPYLGKHLDALVELSGHLTTLSLRVYDLRREYLGPALQGSHDSTHGGELTLIRVLGPRDRLRLSARLDSANQLNGFTYRDRRYAFYYTRELGPKLELSLQGVHLQREGSSQYHANIGELTLQKTF